MNFSISLLEKEIIERIRGLKPYEQLTIIRHSDVSKVKFIFKYERTEIIHNPHIKRPIISALIEDDKLSTDVPLQAPKKHAII